MAFSLIWGKFDSISDQFWMYLIQIQSDSAYSQIFLFFGREEESDFTSFA